MAKPKYQSRAKRAATQASAWRDLAQQLRDLREENTTEEGEDVPAGFEESVVKDAVALLEGFDTGELEALAEEIGSWRDNMSGTSLENTGKFEQVSDAASTLEDIDTEAPEITSLDEIDEAADELENRADELEGVEFPGMFG